MAHIRSPAAQPQLPFLGPVDGGGLSGVFVGVVAAPLTGGVTPLTGGVTPLLTATATAELLGAALAEATGEAVSGGGGGGAALSAAVWLALSAGAAATGVSPPLFITRKVPTMATAAMAMPRPMNEDRLTRGGRWHRGHHHRRGRDGRGDGRRAEREEWPA